MNDRVTEVRMVMIDGKRWFLAEDILRLLGYEFLHRSGVDVGRLIEVEDEPDEQ